MAENIEVNAVLEINIIALIILFSFQVERILLKKSGYKFCFFESAQKGGPWKPGRQKRAPHNDRMSIKMFRLIHT
jgi:hypothetical protein